MSGGESLHEWKARYTSAHHDLIAQLRNRTDGALRAVIDLHTPTAEELNNVQPECPGCDFSGWEGEPPCWPCRTIETIAEHVGVDVGVAS